MHAFGLTDKHLPISGMIYRVGQIK